MHESTAYSGPSSLRVWQSKAGDGHPTSIQDMTPEYYGR